MTLQICSKVLSSSNELKSNSNNISTLHKMYVSYTIDFCVKFRLSNDLTLKLLHLSTTISYGKNYDRKSVRKKPRKTNLEFYRYFLLYLCNSANFSEYSTQCFLLKRHF